MDVREGNEKVKISEEVFKKFEELDNAPHTRWTEEIDAVLLKYWPIKRHKDISELLYELYGIRFHTNTLANRYEVLTGK